MRIYQQAWNTTTAYSSFKDVAFTDSNITGAAAQVNTIQRTTNADHFLTFVDSNNASATAETVYTTSSFTVNPQNGNISIGGALSVSGLYNSPTQTLSLTLGTETWVKLCTLVNRCAVKIQIGTGSNNSEEEAEIEVFGTYNIANTQINVKRQTYNEHLREVRVTQATPGGSKIVYVRLRTDNFAPNINWRLFSSRGVTSLDNVVETPTTGESVIVDQNNGHFTNAITEIANTTNASSITTGALQVAGGVGIGGNLWVGGTINGTASLTSQVTTVLRTTAASHFLTFVDSNNASATAESLYTTSSVYVNPGIGGVVSVGTYTTGGFSSNFTAVPPGTTSSQVTGYSFWGTFFNYPLDIGIRRVADITAGFGPTNGGTWGAEYLAISVGNNGGANDGGFKTSEKVRINSAGSVLIGTTATISGALLTVNGAGYVAGNFTATGSLVVGTAAAGAAGEIRATNEITAYYSSDIRLKENIRLIGNPITIVNQIRGVYYDWTDEHIKARGGEDGYFVRKHDIGVIAQEVEAVLPEIVATRDDGTKVVKYEKLVALLIEAVKDQQRQIDQISQALQNLAIK
jgi:hypothetical protein